MQIYKNKNKSIANVKKTFRAKMTCELVQGTQLLTFITFISFPYIPLLFLFFYYGVCVSVKKREG